MNDNFCILPWIHLHIYPDSTVTGCCIWDRNQVLGNVNDQTLTEIATSTNANTIRYNMLNNIPVSACKQCQEIEKVKGVSKRISVNNLFHNDIQSYVDKTGKDGSIHYDFKLKSMNIRYSNLCNMKCRTCGPLNSSLWAYEKKLKFPVQTISQTSSDYLEKAYEHLPYVKFLNFAGGETMIIEEHWKILDKLLEIGNTDVHISWVTNLSKLTYDKKNLLDYVKLFKNFNIVASIDDIDERAEVYRHGTVWNIVERNLRSLADNDVSYSVNCTVGAMNVWNLPEIHERLLSIDDRFKESKKLKLNNLVNPNWYSTKILPMNLKIVIKNKIDTHIKWLNSIGYDCNQWHKVINFMLNGDHSHLLSSFKKHTIELDNIRNENSIEIFPELRSILE